MTMSGEQFRIRAGEQDATITEIGAALRQYRRGGVDVTVPYGEDVLAPRAAGVVLVPWPNRLRAGRYVFDGQVQQLALSDTDLGNAIHGLGRWSRWQAVRQEGSSVTLRFDIPPQKGYPFEVLVEVTYTLHAETGLSLSVSATNHGRSPAPFGAGFHPYLSTHGNPVDALTAQVPARKRLVLDDAAVPVGQQSVNGTQWDLRRGRRLKTLRLDDAFTDIVARDGRWTAEVRMRKAGARIWGEETFRFVQVMTADNVIGGLPGVAVEPMTCAPDAFNNTDGLIVLEPGGTWSGTCGITPL